VALKKESALDSYSKAWYTELQDDFLTPDDWELLRTIKAFLGPFKRATKATEGDEATLDKVLFTMEIINQHFKMASVKYKMDDFLSLRIQQSWEVFSKYYLKTDDSPYYAAALILHPAYRLKFVTYN